MSTHPNSYGALRTASIAVVLCLLSLAAPAAGRAASDQITILDPTPQLEG